MKSNALHLKPQGMAASVSRLSQQLSFNPFFFQSRDMHITPEKTMYLAKVYQFVQPLDQKILRIFSFDPKGE